MAVTTETFNADGVNRIFTVASTILSQSHCRVDYYYDDEDTGIATDHNIASNVWDVINNSIVFNNAPTAGYIVKITTSTDGEGLETAPSDFGVLSAELDHILNVSDNMPSVLNVSNNMPSVLNVDTNMDKVGSCSSNIEAIKTVASSTGSTGLLAAINIGESIVSNDVVIPIGANGLSFGTVTISLDATVVVEGTWRII